MENNKTIEELMEELMRDSKLGEKLLNEQEEKSFEQLKSELARLILKLLSAATVMKLATNTIDSLNRTLMKLSNENDRQRTEIDALKRTIVYYQKKFN